MHGGKKGIHVIQHNTNDTKTREKPEYMPMMPSGMAFSTEVHHRNNHKGLQSSYYEQHRHGTQTHAEGAQKLVRGTSGKAIAKITSKTAAASSTVTFQRGNDSEA